MTKLSQIQENILLVAERDKILTRANARRVCKYPLNVDFYLEILCKKGYLQKTKTLNLFKFIKSTGEVKEEENEHKTDAFSIGGETPYKGIPPYDEAGDFNSNRESSEWVRNKYG